MFHHSSHSWGNSQCLGGGVSKEKDTQPGIHNIPSFMVIGVTIMVIVPGSRLMMVLLLFVAAVKIKIRYDGFFISFLFVGFMLFL